MNQKQRELLHNHFHLNIFSWCEDQLHTLDDLITVVDKRLRDEVIDRRQELDAHTESKEYSDAKTAFNSRGLGFVSIGEKFLEDDLRKAETQFSELVSQGFIISIFSVVERTLDVVYRYFEETDSLYPFDVAKGVKSARRSIKEIKNHIKVEGSATNVRFEVFEAWTKVRDISAHRSGYVESSELQEIKEVCKLRVEEQRIQLTAEDCRRMIADSFTFIKWLWQNIDFGHLDA